MLKLNPLVFNKCCSDDTRLKCLLLLTRFKELCVCDLTEALKLSQPKVSRHLAELRKAELLLDRRKGKWVYYRLHPALPAWAKQVLDITSDANCSYLHGPLLSLADLSDQARNCDKTSAGAS